MKVFFFHCPKAGGTSIRSALAAAIPQELISPIIENDAVGHASQSDYRSFRGYHLYAGHYGRDIFDAVKDGHLAITNFRHPVARIVSLYNFFRDQVALDPAQLAEERYTAVRFAKEHDFRAFVACDDPRVTVYTRNQHARQLTQSPWENDASRLARARRAVLGMACYYVCEYPDLSTMWLRDALGLAAIGSENRTTLHGGSIDVATLDREVVEKICRDNADDLDLYLLAVRTLLARTGGAAGGSRKRWNPPWRSRGGRGIGKPVAAW